MHRDHHCSTILFWYFESHLQMQESLDYLWQAFCPLIMTSELDNESDEKSSKDQCFLDPLSFPPVQRHKAGKHLARQRQAPAQCQDLRLWLQLERVC